METLTLQFLGAAGTVTGSRHLLSLEGSQPVSRNLLIDCGLFQGPKRWRLQNWEPFQVPPASVQTVALTHAHIDHTGYLPRFIKQGFRGPVYCSRPTADLLGVLLPDSGRLQEEEAAFANRRGFSKHKPALPLYTADDAEDALKYLHRTAHREPVKLDGDIQFHFHDSGHILGSKSIHVEAAGIKLLFTGDLGRCRANGPCPEALLDGCDYIVLESTYGNRLHPAGDFRPRLAQIVRDTVKAGGVVVIPAFAVERTQQLLFILRGMMDESLISKIPIHLDSPMAIEAIRIFMRYSEEFDQETKALIKKHGSPLHWPETYFDKTVEESKRVSALRTPAIIISSSGMATGGRVLHHLAQRLPDRRNAVVFAGYQAAETRGRKLVEGATTLRIHGEDVPVRARIEAFEEFSDHADYAEILRWLGSLPSAPRQIFLVHGEPDAARALEGHIEKKFGWPVHVPQQGERVALQ